MPLFEYRCERCAHLEEVLQKHSDPAPDACPACGERGTMAKAISLTSFQLKGGGWYKDLYSSSSGKSEDNAKGGAAASDSGTTPKPAESRAAESTPAEPKAAEKKPAEAKPAEAKPAEKKPAESKAASASSPST